MSNIVEINSLCVEAKTDSGRKVEIIRDCSFNIAKGEIVALIGESGSGKTTIALTLMGYARPGCRVTSGQVKIAGQDVTQLTERKRAGKRGAEVAYVPQSAAASFNPAYKIMDQVIETTKIHHLMSKDDARSKATELFKALALPNPDVIGERYPHQLSGGQLQRLSAAMALISNPQVVIFDEPTTALDVTTQIDVLRAFKSVMKSKQIAGVYVSHDLAVVAQIADRIVVLRNGEVQEIGTTEAILHSPQHPYTKELLAAFEPAVHARIETPSPKVQQPLLVVENAVAGYGAMGKSGTPAMIAVNHVSFQLDRGQNLGIIGESGCGKSTLARVIAGILPATSGKLFFDGKELPSDLRQRSREQLRELQIVFQFADTALNPAKSIEDILARPLVFYHGMDSRARDQRINELFDMVRLPRALRYRQPNELSGGQKQRVNLARALAADPKLILCDEITSALDTVVAVAIIDLLKELQRELSISYLFISHDLSTVRAICDEVIVMYAGEKVEQLRPELMGEAASHPYSRLLFSSVPKLDTRWLDNLERDADASRQFNRN